MAVGADSPVVADYLQRLQAEATGLSAGRRAELVAEIRAHVAEALAAAGRDDESTVRAVLDRLGEPADIVAAETEDAPPASPVPPAPPVYAIPAGSPAVPRSPWGTLEILAVVALTAGSFLLPGIGLLFGLVFLWASQQWTRREKWVATAWSLGSLVVVALAALVLLTARVEPSFTSEQQQIDAPTVVDATAPPSAVTAPPTAAP